MGRTSKHLDPRFVTELHVHALSRGGSRSFTQHRKAARVHCCQNRYGNSRLMNHWTQARACGVPCRKEKLQSGAGHIARSPGYPSLWWS